MKCLMTTSILVLCLIAGCRKAEPPEQAIGTFLATDLGIKNEWQTMSVCPEIRSGKKTVNVWTIRIQPNTLGNTAMVARVIQDLSTRKISIDQNQQQDLINWAKKDL